MSRTVESFNGFSSPLDGAGYFVRASGSHQIVQIDRPIVDSAEAARLPFSKALYDVGGQVEAIIGLGMNFKDKKQIYKEFEYSSKYRIVTTMAFGLHRVLILDPQYATSSFLQDAEEEFQSLRHSTAIEILHPKLNGKDKVLLQKGIKKISDKKASSNRILSEVPDKLLYGELEQSDMENYINAVTSKADDLLAPREDKDPSLTMRGALALSVLSLEDNAFPGSYVRAKAKEVLKEDERAGEIYDSNDLFHHSPDEMEGRLPRLELSRT